MISTHTITISHAERPSLSPAPIPQDKYFTQWVLAVLHFIDIAYPCEINIRTIESDEMAKLNAQYRNKQGHTNVLAFPLMEYDPQKELPFVGDIVLCSPVIFAEAEKQQKQLLAHWAHLTIHGTLHLLGYTHDIPTNAIKMESAEKKILSELGFPDPYSPTKRAYI